MNSQMETQMETPLSGSNLLVSRLYEGIHFVNRLDKLNIQGRTEDSDIVQSITKDLDKLCHELSGNQEIAYVDCKWLDSIIAARLKYVESIEEWITQARTIVEPLLPAHGSTEVEAITSRVLDLERRFGKKGIDVHSMTQALLSSSSSTSNDIKSSALTEARRDGTRDLHDLEEKYRETFRRMDEYERSRNEDDALKIQGLDNESAHLVQRIKERLRVIEDVEHPATSVSFSKDIASVLISDKITDIIRNNVTDCVNATEAFVQLQINNLTGSLVEDIWKQIQPTLTLVDAVEPRRRVIDLDCPACWKLGSVTAHARHTVPFARAAHPHLVSLS